MEILRLITILGPTATGKTPLAALLASRISGEIISADSRQVYTGMTIGSGKDLNDYIVETQKIPYHIIDVVKPDEEFNVFMYKQLFIKSAKEITDRGNQPILCGGTGLYIDAVLSDYFFAEVPENETLRKELSEKSVEELAGILISMKKIHNKTDLENKERLLRAIEICEYQKTCSHKAERINIIDSKVFGIMLTRENIRQKIDERLKKRIDEGLIEEVETLLKQGVSSERLISFGLEYRFVTLFLLGKTTKEEMQQKLYTAICSFAKRQMTWFRRMERLGTKIHWIDGNLSKEKMLDEIMSCL